MGYTFPVKVYNTYFLAAVSTIGGMLFGFDISSMSAIIGTEQYINYFHNPSGTLQGGIGAALAGGSVIGALMAGPISDKFGRRDSCAFGCIFWLIGTALQVSTTGTGQLIAGRFINGICVGITSSQVPVYLAEIARKDKRGSIIVIQQLAIEIGILLMYFIGYGCSFIGSPTSSTSFRVAWAVQFVPAVLLLALLPLLPRSPRWLAKVGRDTEALDVLSRIQAGGNKSDPLVVAEWDEIQYTMRLEREGPKGWRKFISNGMWRRTFAGVSVQAWQQLSGANVMTYYIVYVFAMAGLSGNINLISSGVQYALFIIFSLVTFLFIDKTGRRPLLIYGALGMAACHLIVGGVLGGAGVSVPGGVGGNANVVIQVTGAASAVVIAFSYLLVIVYALTLAPVAWVYAAEVWSLETRAYGMALASIGNWLFNFAIGFFIPPGFKSISWKIFIIFGVLCIGAAAQAWFSYPETARKSLEEIEAMWKDNALKPWQTKPGQSRLDELASDVELGRNNSLRFAEAEKATAVHNDRTNVLSGSSSQSDKTAVQHNEDRARKSAGM